MPQIRLWRLCRSKQKQHKSIKTLPAAEITHSTLDLSKLKGRLLSWAHMQQHHQLFFCLWNDCCYIYNRPVINAPSGKLVITNSSRNKKISSAELKTSTSGVLSWQNWSGHFVYFFWRLWERSRRREREREGTINSSTPPFTACLYTYDCLEMMCHPRC